ncbi:MAG: hypothetical protein B193_2218 [Solidesulfovibrio magneticus str. Maddingley MBC34]|uniref:Uncharacterized protein n=1 Tax=Solidesulfovibrio magneticus str. Maddingley MBC34 TaxID=1206767 RepID=K6FKL0_9BACT|nr:MAG: hypothetical protein B193_2218 [Solidesulfovibrio magneticus str. Maddingley MBC34]
MPRTIAHALDQRRPSPMPSVLDIAAFLDRAAIPALETGPAESGSPRLSQPTVKNG